MKSSSFFLILGVSFLLGLTSWIAKQNGSEPEIQNSLLWKIEGNNVKAPSYLFGTMHLIEKEYFYFPNSIQKLVKKSNLLVMEIGELPNQAETLKYVQLKEGSFFDYFSPEQTDTILTWAKQKLNMNESVFRASFTSFKPFVLVQAATQMSFMGKTESYEIELGKIADENNIPKKGLETVEQQISFFDKLTKVQQAEMVMAGIRKESESLKLSRDMMGMYSRQRIDSLYMTIQTDGGVLATEQANFLDYRNQNWITQLKDILPNGKAFIAVGAGHLAGENGVISLLRNEGYTVTAVKY